MTPMPTKPVKNDSNNREMGFFKNNENKCKCKNKRLEILYHL